MVLLKGKEITAEIKEEIRQRRKYTRLALPFFEEDPASASYLKSLAKACEEVGIESKPYPLGPKTSQEEMLSLLSRLTGDVQVTGILLPQPLPEGISLAKCLEILPPSKDVEGIAPANYGRLFLAKNIREIEGFPIPATAHAILKLLLSTGMSFKGMEAAVIGRSSIVGRPIAHLLSCLDMTVTLCHSKTENLAQHTQKAKVVVAAVGKPRWLKAEFIHPEAIVIDAGTNYDSEGKLYGDVDFENVAKKASYITPVPGGVGPVTTACLLNNALLLANRI